VHGFHDEAVQVEGTAVLFASSKFAIVPTDISAAVAVLSLDISSLVPQVRRAMLTVLHEMRSTCTATVCLSDAENAATNTSASMDTGPIHCSGAMPEALAEVAATPAAADAEAIAETTRRTTAAAGVPMTAAAPPPTSAIPATPVTVYVQGTGKSGLAAMATIRRMEATIPSFPKVT
jgi:hypothetical protein